MIFGMIAAIVALVDAIGKPAIGIEVGPHEVAGAALGLLLVLRTNASYERWNDGRKYWEESSTAHATWYRRRDLRAGGSALASNDRALDDRVRHRVVRQFAEST